MILPKILKPNEQDNQKENFIVLPVLPLRDIVVFPQMVAPLFVGRPKSVNALTNAMSGDKHIFLATQKKVGVEDPKEKDISIIGTVGTVIQLLRMPDGTVKSLVEGHSRGVIVQFLEEDSFFQVIVEPMLEIEESRTEIEALFRTALKSFEKYAQLNKSVPTDLANTILSLSDPSKMADMVSAHLAFKLKDKQGLLETTSLKKRLSQLVRLIKMECEVFQVNQRIKIRVNDQLEKTHKNFYLNEQMRAIKKEMGNEEDFGGELDELEKRIKRKRRRMSKEACTKCRQEFKKLKMMPPMSPESTVVRNYIEWILDLPWRECSQVRNDIDKAERILDQEHYGLKKPKERILEYLAVQVLMKKIRGPILCFVGPPGVGKTSLAKSVAHATGRKFIRLSLGGVRDEAEIRGHRRTYIGAMPGKIIQSLKKAKVNNPVFCLDEIDKMSMDFRGDPSSALLEVLDPEQNYNFNDHYLDLDYNLSDILFITTANTLPNIPLPLQDRMEIIRLSGYTEHEKEMIAKEFLISKQIRRNGLENRKVEFTAEAILTLIQYYTREAGVRNLEREIASICRKIARKLLKEKQEQDPENYKVNTDLAIEFLGPKPYRYGTMEEKDLIGMVTGLAWTQVGGELLTIETLTMPGKGKLMVTGKLGDVMKESAQAAQSYVRSRAEDFGIATDFFEKNDIHVHVPEGSIPKDGPSAGISICTSLVSALAKIPVSRKIAMTGEITLRGRVLPIGGLKEKVLAAHRGGITKVLIPDENEKDLEDIPDSVSQKMEIILVEQMDQVLEHALVRQKSQDQEVKQKNLKKI